MRIEIKFDKEDQDFFKRAASDKKAKQNIQKWLPVDDEWKKWSNYEFLDFMVQCICSTQQRQDSKFSHFLQSAVNGKRLWAEPKATIEKILRKNSIRFPKRKAEQIASNSKIDFLKLMKKISSNHRSGRIDEERLARKTFMKSMGKGFGLKQASHFLMYVGYSRRLIPVDSRWIKATKNLGVDIEDLSELGYLVVEDAANIAADTLRIKPTELDVAVWTVSE